MLFIAGSNKNYKGFGNEIGGVGWFFWCLNLEKRLQTEVVCRELCMEDSLYFQQLNVHHWMLFCTHIKQSLPEIRSVSPPALNRCVMLPKDIKTLRRVFLLLEPTSKMCLALSTATVQQQCLFLVTVYGDFTLTDYMPWLRNRAVSKDHILLASTLHQTWQVPIGAAECYIKKGGSKARLLQKLPPSFQCNCKAGKYTNPVWSLIIFLLRSQLLEINC